MKRYLKMYRIFIVQYIKNLVQYRSDFMIGIISFVITQFSGILFLYLIFEQIPSLSGWSLDEMVFIYGYFQIPRGLDHLLTDNIWLIPNKIRRGEMDRYLLRPINPLFHCIVERFQPEAFGELVVGIGLLSYTIPKLGIHLGLVEIVFGICFVLIGALIYTTIKLAAASFGFWIMNAMPIMNLVYQFSDFSKYPIGIFPNFIKILITYIVPFAFISYYPSAYFLGYENGSIALLKSFFVLIVFGILSYSLWNKGLKSYQSAGN